MNIIDGRQKKKLKVFEYSITIAGWFLMLGFIFQIILSLLVWLFNINEFYKRLLILDNIGFTFSTLAVTFIITVVFFTSLLFWGRYNLKKFGALTRRTFHPDVTAMDLSNHFKLSIEQIETLQNDKITLLEETIV